MTADAPPSSLLETLTRCARTCGCTTQRRNATLYLEFIEIPIRRAECHAKALPNGRKHRRACARAHSLGARQPRNKSADVTNSSRTQNSALHAPQGVQMTKVADQDSTDLQKCLVVASSLLTVPSPCRLSQVVVLAVDALVFLE